MLAKLDYVKRWGTLRLGVEEAAGERGITEEDEEKRGLRKVEKKTEEKAELMIALKMMQA